MRYDVVGCRDIRSSIFIPESLLAARWEGQGGPRLIYKEQGQGQGSRQDARALETVPDLLRSR